MGIKEIKAERKSLKDWKRELNKEGIDTDNTTNIQHIYGIIKKMIRDQDDDKHNSIITFLKNNQTLVNDTMQIHSPFSEFLDNE